MAQRPYMQAETPAQTEQEGFDVPDMLSISSRNAGYTPGCQCSVCQEGAVHNSAAFWLWLHILLSNMQPMQCWPKQVCLDNRAKHGVRRTNGVACCVSSSWPDHSAPPPSGSPPLCHQVHTNLYRSKWWGELAQVLSGLTGRKEKTKDRRFQSRTSLCLSGQFVDNHLWG